MTVQSLAHFNGQNLSIIDHDGRKWFTAEEVGRGFGYAEGLEKDAVLRLYNRHPDEFRAKDSVTVKLTATDGKAYNKRIFSGTGIIKLGNFANTPRAKEFRNWAADVLDGQAPADSAELERVKAELERLKAELDQARLTDESLDAELMVKMEAALLRTNPQWVLLMKLRAAGLEGRVIARAMGISRSSQERVVREIREAGLGYRLAPPARPPVGRKLATSADPRQMNLEV